MVARGARCLLLSLAVTLGCAHAPDPTREAHRAEIARWRQERVARLTAESGWLTLAGLYWLAEGENAFGRAAGSALVLDHPAMPDVAGAFVLAGRAVRFVARAGAGVTRDGAPVTSIDLVTDAAGEPTVLALGSLRFFAIERSGKPGVRVRDLEHPRRRAFAGLDYFDVDESFAIDARFEPYTPPRALRIANVLGMVEEMQSPGAIVFSRDGAEHRLDAVLDDPKSSELFVIFSDRTSGRETYGAGRFLSAPPPRDGRVRLDFNKAYNPPCAFSPFATCPVPPPQNRLRIAVRAGEKAYAGPHE